MSASDLDTFQDRLGAALAFDDVRAPRANDRALARALAVHRNTAVKAACDALAASYPVVRSLCGDQSFFGLAADYVDQRPPAEPRLNTYGEGFEAYLRSHAALKSSSYVADVAAVERLVAEALFAPDAAPLEMIRAEQVLRTQAGLELHPAARFRQFASPAGSIWLVDQTGGGEGFDAITWTEEAVLVTRPAGRVRVTTLSRGTLAFLAACAAGASLGDAALAADAEGSDLAGVVPSLVTAGAFV